MQKTINIKVNIFYSFPTICTTGASSSRHLAQTAVSSTSSGVFSRALPLLRAWGAVASAAHGCLVTVVGAHLSTLLDLRLSFEPHKPASPSTVWLRLNDSVYLAWVWVI